MSYITTSSKVKIVITTVEGDTFELLSEDLKGDIISLETNKNLYDVAGTWSLTLIARKNLERLLRILNPKSALNLFNVTHYEIFRPMTLIDIYFNNREVMLGIVDEVNRSVSIGNDGSPQKVITIRGRDLGALFIDHKIWYEKNPQAASGRDNFTLVKGLNLIDKVVGQNAAGIMREVFKYYFTDLLNASGIIDPQTNKPVESFKWSDGTLVTDKIVNLTDKIESDNYFDKFPFNLEAWSFEGTIWDFMKTFAAPPFNELFVETGDRDVSMSFLLGKKSLPSKKCYLVFRPTPYDDKSIDLPIPSTIPSKHSIHDLQTHIITDNNIISKSLSVGKNDINNIYRIYPLTFMISSEQGGYVCNPTYDERNLRRYGQNPLEIGLNSIDANDKTNDIFLQAENYQLKLRNWFRNKDKFIRGSFSIRGDETISIGRKLIYSETEEGKIENSFEAGYYYIIGVSHEYNFNETFKTTITVDRGISNKFIPQLKSI